ncbi:hypothetical protein A3G65_00075 [Candidatus Roizmanbacteria bacterium RIFCSPLOWO2_12_FULL_37_7b]|nr:MAG: hypothetical protein A3G65_00075 [Candidatus Roizmanbacteria bacterium RIFCSPLOWO2_12_FULL_37_7b]
MKRKIVPVVIGVVRKDGHYLLTQRDDLDPEDSRYLTYKKPWQFPGGGLEFGESLEECLLRELKEEIGVEVQIERLLPKIFQDTRGWWQGILIPYLCRITEQNPIITLDDEACAYGWYRLEEIRDLHSLPKTLEIAQLAEVTI